MEHNQEDPLDEMRLRRKYAGFFLACALASSGALGIHEVQNGGKPDLLTIVGVVLVSGSLGFATGNFKAYRNLKRQLDAEDE